MSARLTATPPAWPVFSALTPTKVASSPIPEVYYGWLFTNGTYTSGGTTTGFHYESIPFGDGPLVYNLGVTTGPQQPEITVGSALWIMVAAMFYVAGAGLAHATGWVPARLTGASVPTRQHQGASRWPAARETYAALWLPRSTRVQITATATAVGVASTALTAQAKYSRRLAQAWERPR